MPETVGSRPSKADIIYHELRDDIVSGKIRPGDPIDKVFLAKKFGTSRNPIGSAVDRLAYDGLIDVRPQHGSFVSRLNAKKIFDRFFVRKAIESQLVAEAARIMEPELIKRLDLNLRHQQVTLEAGDLEDFFLLDDRFHALIHATVDIREAINILEQIQAYLGRIRRMLQFQPGRVQCTFDQHVTIRDALNAGDPERAIAATFDHINSVESDIRDLVVSRPELFDDA